MSGKGHPAQKKKATRGTVGLTGKSDLLMKKVAEKTMIEWNVIKRT